MTKSLLVLVLAATASLAADPLPSWNDTPRKTAIIAFVEKVTKSGSPDFVPVPERIAVFDNDGTLWSEAPVPTQLFYAFSELKRRAPAEPELAADPMVKAALTGNVEALKANQMAGLIRIVELTHSNMPADTFRSRVQAWTKTFEHPRFKGGLAGTTYQPMQELLSYLRANSFKTFIVSGGGEDFMRAFTEVLYGIPPEQVVGSSGEVKYAMTDGKPVLTKVSGHIFVDDKQGKPVGIYRQIGRRPIFCAGNSDGDQAMLEYTTIGNPRPSFGLIVHHTDAGREYAYDAKPPASGTLITAMKAAPKHGWRLVDMKNDWKTVFPPK